MATRNSSAGKNGALDPALPQKKRARRRLVGAAAVCLMAAIILPIVLDSEPRHAREEVQVRIPSRDTPLRNAEDGAVHGVIGGASRTEPHAVARSQDAENVAEALSDPEADASSEGSPADGPAASRETAAAPVKVPAKVAATDQGTGAAATKSPVPTAGAPTSLAVPAQQTKLEARPDPRAADTRSSFVLQAGAFASEKSAADQQARVRKTGLKAYTEKISTSQGPRIRVRVGPFANREAAEKARATLKAAGVESALIAP